MSSNWASTLKHAVLGEVVGHSVAVGAVYAPHYLAPKFDDQLTEKIARQLANWKHTDARKETENARVLKDDALMQLAGLSNFGTQLWQLSKESSEGTSLGSNIGQVIAGRVGGTTTSLAGEYITRHFAPGLTELVEEKTANGIHWTSHLMGYNKHQRPSKEEKHASDILFSNTVQTLFALPGNVASQQLYERVLRGAEHIR